VAFAVSHRRRAAALWLARVRQWRVTIASGPVDPLTLSADFLARRVNSLTPRPAAEPTTREFIGFPAWAWNLL
jgi:hypothetical protein